MDPVAFARLIDEAAQAIELLDAARFEIERGDYGSVSLEIAYDWLEDIARQLVTLRTGDES